ncbi:hypothetical protein B0H14DRAFT_2403154 [Mycena olivaceomarginata]|nr:hypothetical protein B0H14DRAFT_2403154 [Mycena olivaceomarginata]
MAANPPPVKKVRQYKKIPSLVIPSLPQLSSALLATQSAYTCSPTASTASSVPPETPSTSTTSPVSSSILSVPSAAPSPATVSPVSFTTSTQPRLRAPRVPKRTEFEKINTLLEDWPFSSLGSFLQTLFYNHRRGELDPRTKRHERVVTRFLQGKDKVKMADIIELIYHHRQSRPKPKYPAERAAAFSARIPFGTLKHAAPALSAWATQLVKARAHFVVGKLAQKKRGDPTSRSHIRARSNGRQEDVRTATWEDVKFTILDVAQHYEREGELIWDLTEAMAAPKKNGVVVVRKRRPHPVIQVGAISSFVLSRNRYASGDLALPLALWHFACKSHIDVKRVYCRFGSIVSDSAARNALNTMTDASFAALRDSVAEAAERGEAVWGKILDNCQQYSPVWEHGIGRDNQLKVGTACTAFRLYDCKPGAFNADDHIARILQEERQNMTTDGLLDSIDWDHVNGVMHLHYVRILVEFVPVLQPLSKEITALFRNKYAIHRIPDRGMTELQPLGTNSEHSTETQGMSRARVDFDQQMGIDPEKSKNILDWIRGDGASFATLKRLQKYESTTLDVYKSCRNVITTPETWHTKATELNACASNHYGPAVSKDPSALSRSSHATNMKRPTDLKKCDFYPTSRSMTLIWEAQLLDCWRLQLGIDADFQAHFDELNSCDALPTLDDLIEHAQVIRVRYASQTAYELSLSNTESQKAPSTFKVPVGEPWVRDHTPPPSRTPASSEPYTGDEVPVAASNKGPKTHVEPEDFDGDRVLSNSIIFLQEFGWWVELCYAIPEGDIGRVLEIFKIFIFTFAGGANLNYTRYLLDLHALLTYECSPDLKEAMLNNWFMFLSEDIRIAVEGDITQEWSNKWMEGMLSKRGGEWDDKFYRQTISPNVRHFLQLKEDMESAFELKRRGKAHTSPHLRDETKILLRMYKEEELHYFRSGRSMGHAAVNRFDRGYQRLRQGKMAEFLEEGAAYADILREMENLRNRGPETEPPSDSSPAATERVSSPIRVDSPSSSEDSNSDSSESSSASEPSTPPPSEAPEPSNCVEEWDNTDHSEDQLESGSDLAPYIDADGKMNTDWYDVEEFEKILEVEGEGDASDAESDDSVQSEVEREESEDDIENSSASENSDEDE